jgi:beta-galactosidase
MNRDCARASTRDLCVCSRCGWIVSVTTRGATYAAGPLEGRPAVTRNELGAGVVYYCSAGLDRAGMSLLLERARADAGVEPLLHAPDGVEVCRRAAEDRSYLFVLNHTDGDVEIEMPSEETFHLLGDGEVGGTLPLGPLGVAVLREQRPG